MEDEIECDDDDYTMQAMVSGGGDIQLFSRFQSQHDDDYQVCGEIRQQKQGRFLGFLLKHKMLLLGLILYGS
jgi:hypothetical protein